MRGTLRACYRVGMDNQRMDRLAVALSRKRVLELIGASAIALLAPSAPANARKKRRRRKKHGNSPNPFSLSPPLGPLPPGLPPGPPALPPPLPPPQNNLFFCPAGSRNACGTGQNVTPPSCFCNLDYQGQNVCTGERTSTPCTSHADCGPGQFCAQRRVDLQPGTSENICAYRCEVRGGFFPF